MLVDTRVFDDDYLPRRLHHREASQQTLARALAPVTRGKSADDVLVAGPSGVGKTALARHTLRRVRKRATVHYTHVRCLGLTVADILRAALDGHPDGDSAAVSHEVGTLQDRLRDVVTDPYVLILDEADGLPETGALDALLTVDGVSVVVCCHDAADWLARLEHGHQQRFRQPIRLDRYGVDELADILEPRARQGLRPDSVRRPVLEAIADQAAGVARVGVQTLRAAAEIAAGRGASQIPLDVVPEAREVAERRIRKANLRSLLVHHHVLYALIHDAGAIRPRELYDRYDEVADRLYQGRQQTPISERACRTKLRKLRDYGLIKQVGENRHVRYRVVDGAIAPPVALPREIPE